MSTQNATALEAQPSVKRDVIFARTEDGVIFHNASTGFQVAGHTAYEFARKIMPHLDGRTPVVEIRDALPAQHRQTFLSLLASLTHYGFVRTEEPGDDAVPIPDRVANHFAPQINYIGHYRGGARRRFRRVRAARIVVLGNDDTARWVVLGLLRNGFPSVGAEVTLLEADDAGASIVDELDQLTAAGAPAVVEGLDAAADWSAIGDCQAVVVCGNGAAARTASLLGAGIPRGVFLLNASRAGDRIVVGPIMSRGVPGCLTCVLLRTAATDEPDRLAATLDLWAGLTGLTVPATEDPGSRPVAAMLGNLLAYEIFRQVSGLLPPESQGAIIVQHLGSADVSTETLVAHPRCARCGPLLAGLDDELYTVVPEERPRVEATTDASEEPAQQNGANRFQSLFGTNVGILTRFDDAVDEQLPVRVGRVVARIAPGQQRRIVAFDVHTTYAARTRAICCAAAVYAMANGSVVEVEPGDHPIVAPRRIAHAAVTLAEATPRAVRGVTLIGRHDVGVPVAAVLTSGATNANGLFHRTAAGVVAAPSLATAVGGAILSGIAGATLLSAVTHPDRSLVTKVDLETLRADDQLAYLLASAENLRAEVEVLDVRSTTGTSVALVRASDATGPETVWAVGSGLSWRQAATTALCDAIGRLQVRSGTGDLDLGLAWLEAFHPWSVVPSAVIAAPLQQSSTFEDLRGALLRTGTDIVLVDIGGADLSTGGLRVVRALVVTD